jgi:hypothetical protein
MSEEVAWGLLTVGAGAGAVGAYELATHWDDEEPEPTGIARPVNQSERRRIKRQIEEQQGNK